MGIDTTPSKSIMRVIILLAAVAAVNCYEFKKLEKGAEKAAVQGTKVKNLAIRNLQKVADKHNFNVNVKQIEKKVIKQLKQASKYESMVHKYADSAKKGAGEWSKSSPLDILAVLNDEATGAINSKVSNKDAQKTLFDFLKVVSDE